MLSWLADWRHLNTSVPLHQPPPTLTLWTDAPLDGWEAQPNLHKHFKGRWTVNQQVHHITWKELCAVKETLERLEVPPNSSLKIMSDATKAVAVISNQGSSTSRALQDLMKQILEIMTVKRITISASPR